MKITLATLALLSLTACTQAPVAVVDTHDADVAAIQASAQAAEAAWTAKDTDKIILQYAADATMIVPNTPVVKGPEAIRGMLVGLFKDPLAALTLTVTVTEVSGNLGYQRGNYSLNVTDPKTKKPFTEKGTYVMVYKKQPDGSWKVIEDINAAGPLL